MARSKSTPASTPTKAEKAQPTAPPKRPAIWIGKHPEENHPTHVMVTAKNLSVCRRYTTLRMELAPENVVKCADCRVRTPKDIIKKLEARKNRKG